MCATDLLRDRAARLAAVGRVAREAFALLAAAGEPLSAYELLWRLELRRGKRTPPSTIYRSLQALTQAGLVHRVARLSAFVVCAMPDIAHDPAFLICERCGGVDEVDATDAVARARAAIADRLSVKHLTIEAHGICARCTGAARS